MNKNLLNLLPQHIDVFIVGREYDQDYWCLLFVVYLSRVKLLEEITTVYDMNEDLPENVDIDGIEKIPAMNIDGQIVQGLQVYSWLKNFIGKIKNEIQDQQMKGDLRMMELTLTKILDLMSGYTTNSKRTTSSNSSNISSQNDKIHEDKLYESPDKNDEDVKYSSNNSKKEKHKIPIKQRLENLKNKTDKKNYYDNSEDFKKSTTSQPNEEQKISSPPISVLFRRKSPIKKEINQQQINDFLKKPTQEEAFAMFNNN